MKNKLGITNDGINTGDYSGMMTVSRALTDSEKKIIRNSVEHGYELFTSKAAEGRHMSIDALKAVASGRVWTGTQAKENGLVDILGNLDDAVQIAATKAGVGSDYIVRYILNKKLNLRRLWKSSKARLKQS